MTERAAAGMDALAAAGGIDPATGRALIDYLVQSGWIGAVILIVSLFAAGLVFAQLFRLRRAKLAPDEHVASLRTLLDAGRVDEARAWCLDPANESFLTRVFGGALVRCSRSAFGLLELRSAIEATGETELARVQRPTDGVQLVAQVAPMLGLLGTVVGMVGAFDAISAADATQRSDLLAGHISAALVTTVLGLLVAIPTTAAYTFLRNRAEALSVEVGSTIEELASRVEGVDGRPAQQPARAQPVSRATQPPKPATPTPPKASEPARPRPVPRPSQPGAPG